MAKYTKRRDKRGYEWKSAYREKEALMLERGYSEVSPHDFYRELFPAGSLQQEPEDGKGNIIATQIRPSGKGRTRQWVIDDSLKMLDKVIGDRFGLIPPISFYGKSHTKENAHELFAVVVDVDYVGKQQLKNLLKQKEKLESLGKNSIVLKIAKKEKYKLGATRFGGKPDVPPDFVWPTYEGESYDHVVKDRPLTFLAQFNCEELAQFDKEHLLPDHGLLSFFYETDTQCWGYDPKDKGCARVYWFEDLSALSAANFPVDMEEDFKFPMVKIKMDAKYSYPSWQDFHEVFPDEKDDEAFNDAWEELTGEDPEDPDDRSQLLGWPYVI